MRSGILVLRILNGAVTAFHFSGKAGRVKLVSVAEGSFEDGELDAGFVGRIERHPAAARAYLILPPAETVLKNTVLPVREDEKILKVLRMEAEKFLTYPADEAAVDFSVTHDSKKGVEVLAAYVRKQRLAFYLDLFKNTRVKLQAVVPDLFCLGQASDTDSPFFLVETLDRLLRISVISKKSPALIRSVKGEDASFNPVNAVKGEVGVLQGIFALKHPEASIDAVLVSGGASGAAEIAAALPEDSGLKVDVLSVSGFVEDSRPEEQRNGSPAGIEYAAGLARAVFSGKKLPDLKGRKISSGKKDSPVLTAVLSVLMLALILSWVFAGLREKQRELARLEWEISEIVSESFAAPELAGRSGMEIVSILRERSGLRGTMLSALEATGVARALEVLRELSIKIPEERGIVITAIRIDREMCYVDGRADSFRQAEGVLNNLLGSEYFRNAGLARAQVDSERDGVVFRIEVDLPGEFYEGAGL